MRWVVVVLLAIVGAYMVFDGLRALTVGDYLTPSSGAYAGQLGPWSNLVAGLGIDPRSTAMKVGFVVIGTAHLLAGLGMSTSTATGVAWAAIAVGVSGLWYLPFGTVADAIVVGVVATTSIAPWR